MTEERPVIRTPFIYALKDGNLYMARLLMREGADVTLKTSDGCNLIYTYIGSQQVAVKVGDRKGRCKGEGVNDQEQQSTNAFDSLSSARHNRRLRSPSPEGKRPFHPFPHNRVGVDPFRLAGTVL